GATTAPRHGRGRPPQQGAAAEAARPVAADHGAGMKASTERLLHLARVACAALALAVMLPSSMGGSLGPSPAHAQEAGERRGGGILRFLFPRNERQDRAAPPAASAPDRAARRPAQRRTA